MKNIHLLPTEKPSYLYKMNNDKLYLSDLFEKGNSTWHNQNIYITADEEIKEEDWVFDIELNRIEKCQYSGIFRNWKKIILTTDLDLVADGVQAIDYEFLNWFVENQKCENVEVKTILSNNRRVFYGYEIIIPKKDYKEDDFEWVSAGEERIKLNFQKQDYNMEVHLKHCYQGEYEDSCKYGDDDCPSKIKEIIMNNKIEPRYVTFEQAKFLKEKGFDDDNCQTIYYGDIEEEFLPEGGIEISDRDLRNITVGEFDYLAPEQHIVVEWLRINYDIWVSVKKDYHNGSFLGFEAVIDNKDGFVEDCGTFSTPQEAYSAAFDYIKENNLI